MILRLNAMRQLGLVAALATLTSLSMAAGRLTAVQIPAEQGDQETVVLSLTGNPSEVTSLPFPEARQGVLVLKQTELAVDQKLWKPQGTLLQALSLKPLEGPDGTQSVQVTLDLGTGVTFKADTKPGKVSITLTRPRPAAQADAADSAPIELSNAELASNASTLPTLPVAGHGQDATDSKAVLRGFKYYTPETMEKSAPVTPEEKEQLLTEEIFRQRVSLDFKDAELQNVIRLLASKTNLNIILTKDQVKGTVTLKLTNVPLGTALSAILKSNNLAYLVEQGGIVRIVPLSQVRTEKVETRTEYLPVNWITASNLVVTLKPFLSTEGKIQADVDSNGILVTDVPERVALIAKLIERIDLPEKQVMIEARLVDLTDAAQRDLGINWQWYRNAAEVFTDAGTADQERLIFADDVMSKGNPVESVNSGNFIRSGGNSIDIFGNTYLLDVALTALEERNLATVLANPKIVTLNNLMARIEIKKQNPYISATQTSQNSFGTVSFKETGVILEVVPNVTNNGYVRMTLKPEQKVRKGDFQGLSASPVPIIDERSVESSVIVKDEETVVLGGLRQIDNSNSESGIPFLMRIPVLGWFFKNSKTNLEKTELVLFVTPHIVKDPTLSSRELRQYEQIDYNWDLPDYFYDETTLRETPPAGTQQ